MQIRSWRTLVTLVVATLLSTNKVWAKVQATIGRQSDTTHLEFNGLDTWDYKITRKNEKTFEIVVPRFDESDIPALAAWTDNLVEKIEVNHQYVDDKSLLTVKVKDPIAESFDYQTDKPSRLIVDFYLDAKLLRKRREEQAKKNEEEKKKAIAKSEAKKQVFRKGDYVRIDRVPAGSEIIKDNKKDDLQIYDDTKIGLFDAGDPKYDRFRIRDYEIKEESIIASRQNIYIRFPILKLKTNYLDDVLSWNPEYIIRPDKGKENKEAQFLKVLYDKKRDAAFLKSYEYFIKKYPKTRYKQILNHMFADVHYRQWQQTKNDFHYKTAMRVYSLLLSEYPDSPLSERTNLLINYTELGRKNGTYSIQLFQKFAQNYPNSEYFDRAKFAIAEGLLILNKYPDAREVYNDVIENHKTNIAMVESYYRLGDISFQEMDYKKAIEHYEWAVKNYPQFERRFPNAHYNMGESHFWLGEYKESLEHHVKYISLYPNDEYNNYSLTRIGELLDILGADKGRVMGAFLESYFRFEGSPGAMIARVRMLKQQMKGMKERELEKTLEELGELSKDTSLPNMKEFVTLMIADGLSERNEYHRSLVYLIDFYQKNPTKVSLSLFKKRIVDNIADSMIQYLNKENFLPVLQLYGRYANTWLRNAERIDLQFFLGRSFEFAGVYDEAGDIYERALAQRLEIVGSKQELEKKVNEHLPSVNTLRLRLASVRLNQRKYAESFNQIGKIDGKDGLSDRERVEQVEISARVFKERNQLKQALARFKDLIKKWDSKPELLSDTYLRAAEIEFKIGRFAQAEESARKAVEYYLKQIDEKSTDEEIQKHRIEGAAKSYKLVGDSLFAQGRKIASIEVYSELLGNYEKIIPLQATRYRLGEILFNNNNINGAQKVWSQIDETDGSFYRKLADEKLEQLKWNKEYSKYINRIPAMVNVK